MAIAFSEAMGLAHQDLGLVLVSRRARHSRGADAVEGDLDAVDPS
jgi:hypothetical protein